jgi:hypothetical protein
MIDVFTEPSRANRRYLLETRGPHSHRLVFTLGPNFTRDAGVGSARLIRKRSDPLPSICWYTARF